MAGKTDGEKGGEREKALMLPCLSLVLISLVPRLYSTFVGGRGAGERG
jgi:hypothetical protein